MARNPETKEGRSTEIRVLVAGRDSDLESWVRSGLRGLPHELSTHEELPLLKPGPGGDRIPEGFDPDLAVVDEEAATGFPDRLRAFKEAHPRCQIFLLGSEDSDLTPRRLRPVAIRHWFFRPFDPVELERVLSAAGHSLQRQWREEHRHSRSLSGFEGLVGEHPTLLAALEMARRVAESRDTSVLILGETGTGKGMLAKAIHTESPRSSGPYQELNCGAIPENLMESEFFGHVKGAFTSAVADKPGLLELADGGTAFLDEVGELGLPMQAKILKFLDDGQIRRVQGVETLKVGVRMIAATNRNLEEEVEGGGFRLDLFHRLNVVSIELPPLRERASDIPMLAAHYLRELSNKIQGTALHWSEDALVALEAYPWPGNVRELINVTERMVLVTRDTDTISAEDLPQELVTPKAFLKANPQSGIPIVELPPGGVSLRDVEKALLEAALSQTQGNVTEAARLLQMSRGSFRYRLEKLGLREKASRRRGRPMRRRRAA